MLREITNTKHVEAFAVQLFEEGVSFHPDNDFNNYIVTKTDNPFYTKDEAEIRNELMNQCFEVCQKDGISIYDVMSEVLLKETNLNKYISLPPSIIS